MKVLQYYCLLAVSLFLIPFIIAQLVMVQQPVPEIINRNQEVVFATNVQSLSEQVIERENILVYFTHSQEAYMPIVAKSTGKLAAYHANENITKFQQAIRTVYSFQQMNVDFLEMDTMKQLTNMNQSFSHAYSAVRKPLKNKIQSGQYKYVVDFHRDAAKK